MLPPLEGRAKAPRGIVFIQTDQHRADCLNLAGHPLLRTPNLNRLGREGAWFRNAYTAIPVCIPARTSLMCGQWSFHHGVLANWDLAETQAQLDPKETTWSGVLAGRGVNAEYIGRWHVSRDHNPTAYGFRHFQSDSGYAAWRAQQGLPPAPGDNWFFGQVDPYITPEQSALAWVFDRSIARLQVLAKERAPFFLRIDTLEPHLPNRICEPYASMYAPERIAPWGSFGETFENKPHIQAQQLRTWGIENWTWQDWAPVVGRYLGEIELIDHQVGRVLNELERLGLSDDVLVVYTADHGDMCGAHRMIDKHYVMYDDVVRIPLLMRWPNGLPAGTVVDGFVSATIDLASTFVDVMGATVPASFDGYSLCPMFKDPSLVVRREIYSAYHGNQIGLFSQRMVFDGCWKFVWNASAQDELYNLQEDPFELKNRYFDRDAAPALEAARKRLIEIMEEERDPLLNQWTRATIAKG